MTSVTLGPIRRLLLLGGGDLLLRLAETGWRCGLAVDVITSPDQAKEKLPGSGRSLAAALRAIDTKPTVVAKLDQTAPQLAGDADTTLALSIGARWIFRPDKIERWFGGKLFNLHGTRLPQNRGGGTWSWQILTGNRFGFCQLHQVDGGTDTGPI